MDLFVINRYQNETAVNLGEDEEKRLQKVLKKMQKRKIQRELEKETQPTLSTLNVKKKIRAKKAKIAKAAEEQAVLKPLEEATEKSTDLKPTEESTVTKDEDEELVKKPVKKKKKVQLNSVEGYTILGSDTFAKKKSALRVLPKWLRHPSLVSTDLTQNVKLSKINELRSDLKARLKQNNIKKLFPIQAEFIPWQMSASKYSDLLIPQDVCVSAPTGSGKTLAFTIPVIQYLTQKLEQRCITSKLIRVLIVLPTQTLAQQIFDTFKSYCVGTTLDVGIATGEKSFQNEQRQLVETNSVWGTTSRVDILVCTAGRLVDHIKMTKGFDLKNLEYLIIDEADRVLDAVQDDWLHHLQVHIRDVQHSMQILNLLSSKVRKGRPQKLLFSATLSQDPEKLEKLSLFQPKLFTSTKKDTSKEMPENKSIFVGKYTTPSELTEKYVICTLDIKPLVIYKLINDIVETNKSPRILIFVNSTNNAHRLKVLLASMSENLLNIGEISSRHTTHKERNNLLADFLGGDINILICTDLMTRGIDFPNVDCVISYNVPLFLKTYIHRVGRTARAGCKGLAITILEPEYKDSFMVMLEQGSKDNLEQIQIPNDELEPFTALYQKALEVLKTQVANETINDFNMTRKRKNPYAAFSNSWTKRRYTNAY